MKKGRWVFVPTGHAILVFPTLVDDEQQEVEK